MGKARRRVQHTSLQSLPEPREGEVIMRVVGPRGSNIIEVEDENCRPTLCMLPAKFHKVLWLKRGNFVIVDEGDRDAADSAGSKVTGTISTVLYAEHVTALRKTSFWPAGFNKALEVSAESSVLDLSSLSLQSREIGDKTNVEIETNGSVVETRGSRDFSEEKKDESSSDEGDDLPPLEENFNRKNIPSFSDSSDSEDERTT